MSDQPNRQQAISALAEMLTDAHVVMLTTVKDEGSLRSRPMVRAVTEFHGDLWFFADQASAKVDDILADPNVNLSYADAANRCYISMSLGRQRSFPTGRMSSCYGKRATDSGCRTGLRPVRCRW